MIRNVLDTLKGLKTKSGVSSTVAKDRPRSTTVDVGEAFEVEHGIVQDNQTARTTVVSNLLRHDETF
jgi:hypothetical protein